MGIRSADLICFAPKGSWREKILPPWSGCFFAKYDYHSIPILWPNEIRFYQPRFPWDFRGFPWNQLPLWGEVVWGRYKFDQNYENHHLNRLSQLLFFTRATGTSTTPQQLPSLKLTKTPLKLSSNHLWNHFPRWWSWRNFWNHPQGGPPCRSLEMELRYGTPINGLIINRFVWGES